MTSDIAIKKQNFDEKQVNITVFGPGIGESITIYIPGLGWGVIDSCKTKTSKGIVNPALSYLREHNVERLVFLVLTHFHFDHYDGLTDIIDSYMGSIDRICYYAGDGLTQYREYLAKKKILQEPGMTKFKNIFGKFDEAKKRGANIVRISERTEIVRKRDLDGGSVEIISLSPSAEATTKYCEYLFSCIQDGKPISEIKDNHQNLLSTAIYCKVGNKTFIFGSDLENINSTGSGWKGVLNNIDCPNLSANFVKIPHHGSSNAFNSDVWCEFCKDCKPIAVATPYTRSKLPEKETIKQISEYAKDVYLTSHTKAVSPSKIYGDIPCEALPGIISWNYMKSSRVIGYISASFSATDINSTNIYCKKPAFKFQNK